MSLNIEAINPAGERGDGFQEDVFMDTNKPSIGRVAFRLIATAAILAPMATATSGATCVSPSEPENVRFQPLTAPDGRTVDLNAPRGGVSVVVFVSAECPMSNAYSPTLNQIANAFAGKPFQMVGVCVDIDLTDAEVAAHARDFRLKFPIVRDRVGALATQLGAKVTPEAFVIDDRGRVRYYGRIDDQFVARGKRNANSSTSELRDAIAAVLAGREVANQFVEAVGCPIPEPPPGVGTLPKD